MPITVKNFNKVYHATPGAYHNPTLGLISLSSDGNNWITLSDKNLGATEVQTSYNINANNNGNLYQRGNNYGFPRDGSGITMSTTKVNASTYGPGNYYSSSTFINTGHENWDSSNNTNLWGDDTNTLEARRGPCPEGWHVPSSTDLDTVTSILLSFGVLINDNTYDTYTYELYNTVCYILKSYGNNRIYAGNLVPLRASFLNSSSPIIAGNEYKIKRLYASTATGVSEVYYRYGTNLYDQITCDPQIGTVIRPFKNVPVVPDETRDVLYDPNATFITTSGIYWNEAAGLISLSTDGTSWTTIADRNQGAYKPYNYTDSTLTEATCGKYYQWGNNNGFPFTGVTGTTSGLQVSTSGKGPGNYYMSDTFRTTSNKDWSNPSNNNLWGDTTNTLEGRRGPCGKGYHIPDGTGFTTLKNLLGGLGLSTTNGVHAKNYLKLPYAGYLNPGSPGTPDSQNGSGRYHTSGTSSTYAVTTMMTDASFIDSTNVHRCASFSIRPFKNDPVQPTTSWTKLY